ncbi:hypothetical protein FIBSPDRAFT_962818 [Athelia psychrophila]|uniref:DNA breaking-rejoining enzyme n=1 Tax=Athelia psychrophila TaxID=1759441 RepID=A0A165ZMD3_9AGAM|nr:hypothetical protein FIBSPDRAFT_962818 [Fibularhizoctonia sp. CBS 109695]
MHVDIDLPFMVCESPLVQRLIRGIKRYHGKCDRKPKQPITLPVLLTILDHLAPGTTKKWEPCLILVVTVLHPYEVRSYPYTGTVPIPNLILTLPASKTDPFCKGVAITVTAAPGSRSCPVAALKFYFRQYCRDGETPLFEDVDGTVLYRGHFIAAVRTVLLAAGFNPSVYAGHSFRRGAASSAAAAGFSDYEIQLLGRWRSDAYKLYIEADSSRIICLSSLLHWVHPQSAPYEPPVLHGSPPLA